MLRIDCPFCGLRNHHEFTYLEDGSVTMPDLSSTEEEAWYEAVFLRENPRGIHIEDWHHTQGCRMVVRVKRDTATHKILFEPAHLDYKKTHDPTLGHATSPLYERQGGQADGFIQARQRWKGQSGQACFVSV